MRRKREAHEESEEEDRKNEGEQFDHGRGWGDKNDVSLCRRRLKTK